MFELATIQDLDVSDLWCVDCGHKNIKLVSFDSEFSTRISKLILEIHEVGDRLATLEEAMEIENLSLETFQ